MSELIIRYVHFLGVFGLVSSLVAEHLLISKETKIEQFKKLVLTDLVYGISAVIALVSGLSLWLWVGKPADFYSANWIFHAKLTLFVLTFLFSLYPTKFFLKHRNTESEAVSIPKSVIMVIRLELLLVFIIPFFAVLMANGY